MDDPILVHCAGSGASGHRCVCPSTHGLCSCCGRVMALLDDGTLPDHQRHDIVAMVKRGDFDDAGGGS